MAYQFRESLFVLGGHRIVHVALRETQHVEGAHERIFFQNFLAHHAGEEVVDAHARAIRGTRGGLAWVHGAGERVARNCA